MADRFRAHRLRTIVMAALAFATSVLIVTQMSFHGAPLSLPASVLNLAGGPVLGALTYLSGLPSKIGAVNAAFWEVGLAGAVVEAAYVVTTAFVWFWIVDVVVGR